jgi:GTP cyclohydrolase II
MQQVVNIKAPKVRQSVKVPVGQKGVLADFITFHNLSDAGEHVVIGLGAWQSADVLRVRIHSECLTGDVFNSGRCDCGPQLQEAIDSFAETGGVILYLRQEGRGIGLYNKLDAYALQDLGYDTYTANAMLHLPLDGRNYQVAAEMLVALQKKTIKLLSNNPEKSRSLREHGIQVVELQPTGVFLTSSNRKYLEAKVEKTAHTIVLQKVTGGL